MSSYEKADRVGIRREIEQLFPKLVSTNYYALYLNGSRLFGTSREKSDWDFIAVYDDYHPGTELESQKLDVRLMQKKNFQAWLDRYQNRAIECLFLPEEFVIISPPSPWEVQIDKQRLNKAFVANTEDKWIVTKKMFENQHKPLVNLRPGRKRLHHCLRILDFAIQINKFDAIKDYQAMAHEFSNIVDNPSTEWTEYENKWRPVYEDLLATLETFQL